MGEKGVLGSDNEQVHHVTNVSDDRSGNDRTVETTSGEELDDLLRAGANERRRAIVQELRTEEGPIALSDLSGRLAGSDGVASDSPVEHSVVEQLVIELYHVHVPHLADVNVVQFEEDRQTVEKGDAYERLARLIGPELE